MITVEEFQHLLRQFTNLENCEVEGNNPNVFTPTNMVNVKGVILCYGEYLHWEVPVDLATINNADAVMNFVQALQTSFDEAAKQQKRLVN